MTHIQLIILISLIIAILLSVDIVRLIKRRKIKVKEHSLQKKANSINNREKIQKSGNKELSNLYEKKINHKNVQSLNQIFSKVSKQQFKKSFSEHSDIELNVIQYFISAPYGYMFKGSDLAMLFEHSGLKFNPKEKRFDYPIQDKDILFNISSHLPVIGFDPRKFKSLDYTCLLCTCNINDLAESYHPKRCSYCFISIIKKLNSHLGGILLNEKKQRCFDDNKNFYK